MEPDEVLAVVMDCARAVMAEWREDADFDLDRALGAGGYMFDDWGSVRSLAEEIVDCVEKELGVDEEVIELPGSYPPSSIRDGTLGDLCNDLVRRILKALA